MTFQKGQSGNPAGRKANEKVARQALITELSVRYGGLPQGLRIIAEKLVDIAVDKDHPKQFAAVQEVQDRIDGKPAQAIVGDPEQPLQLQIENVTDKILKLLPQNALESIVSEDALKIGSIETVEKINGSAQ